MTFRVRWSRETKQQLAGIWLVASDRNAVTRASNSIDKALAKDPHTAGQPLAEGLWKIEIMPLVAYFEIDEPNKTIHVNGISYVP